MHKTIAKGLFYGVATVLILWTASLTYSFVATALPQTHWLVPLFALVIFDVGMLAWLKVFLDYAQGSGQRALALILSLFDFLGVGLMVLAEILLGGQTMVAPPENLGEYAIWGIAAVKWYCRARWTWSSTRRSRSCRPGAWPSAASCPIGWPMAC